MAETLELTIAPVWDEIGGVREQSLDFVADRGMGPDAADAICMVACELTENATKYGKFASEAEGRIDISLSVESEAVTVEVKNPVGEDADLERLDRMIQWIRGFQDPFQSYVERLKIVSSRSIDDDESGLGLVRIAYEGQSILDFYVDDAGTLSVSAVYRL